MSILASLAAHDDTPAGRTDLVVEPSVKDLGGFRVRRALPSARSHARRERSVIG